MSNGTNPKPFVFAASQAWDGNDGTWSTFVVRVGTPEQTFRIIPATSGHETLVPVPEGCTEQDPNNCGKLRGVYPFNGEYSKGFQTNSSSTWKQIGLYSLDLGDKLGLNNNGLYGFDTVGLMLQNSGGSSLAGQIVAGIATKDFYVGSFGLGPKPSNFSEFQYPQPSMMRNLRDQNKIPSFSFSYTAGASYRTPKALGSLTLGGFDTSKFLPNNQTFPFNQDDSKVLSVGVQRITATNTLLGTTSFLSSQMYSLIDSTVPHIWLPRSACDIFESAFGLTYDASTDLYTVNDTVHERLKQLQPTITISLGNENNPADLVSIQLPYGAFDLQATDPIYKNATNYFPIRRAANDTQYTLGRTFLQEAYVIADYERSNFSVYQTRFANPPLPQDIVTIEAPVKNSNNGPGNTDTSSKPSSGLSIGAIVGIAVGIGIVAILLAIAFILVYRRRKSRKRPTPSELETPKAFATHEMDSQNTTKYEMSQPPPEAPGSHSKYELHCPKDVHLISDDRFRSQRDGERFEMPGDERYRSPTG